MTDVVKTVESIKRYCGTICDDNELKGFRPVRRGLKYHRTIAGIKRKLHHKVKKAAPITPDLLEKILHVVKLDDDQEYVAWVASLTGYHAALRKSNMVPLKRVHDTVQNISRKDVRYSNGVMIFTMDWSKTNQFQERTDISPLVANKYSPICPVRWLLSMMNKIPAGPQHNLFSFYDTAGNLVPITYRDLMKFMRPG